MSDTTERLFLNAYQTYFPGLVGAGAYIGDDGCDTYGRKGIDRILYLGQRRLLYVKEVVNPIALPDYIALEVSTDERANAPGWIERQQTGQDVPDYVAFLMHNGTVHLFPMDALLRAWNRQRHLWMKREKIHATVNHRRVCYIVVPVKAIQWAIGYASEIPA